MRFRKLLREWFRSASSPKHLGLFLTIIVLFVLFLSFPVSLFVAKAAEPILINGKRQMAAGETQVLSIMNYRSGSTYTWTLLEGGGELEGNGGEKVTYVAPQFNPNCQNNPLIRVTDSKGDAGEVRIAVNCYTGLERAYWTDDDYYVSPYTGVPYSKRLFYYRKSYNCRAGLLASYKESCTCTNTWCEDTDPPHLDFGCKNPGSYTICEHAYCHDLDESCDLWGSWQYACIGDGRSETIKAAGCCPEALLPEYALKVPQPDDLELGNDPSLNIPVCDPSLKGNPIRISDGNNLETVEDVSLRSPFRGGLAFKRYYSSRSKATGSLGFGWTHTFSATMDPDYVWKRESYLRVVDETGRGVYFQENGAGQYRGMFKERSKVLLVEENYVWMRLDGRRYVFGGDGRLLWIEDRIGNRQVLTYDADGRRTQVRDAASGRVLRFQYDDQDRIVSIRGPSTGAVADGVWVTYGYDENGNLTSATYADGSGFRYAYGDPKDVHNLTEKRDAEGHLLSTWTYDDKDRAIGNFTRDGRGVTIEYVSDYESRVTDAYGVTRTYWMWDTAGRRKRITDIEGPEGCTTCGEEIVRLEYDADLNVIEVAYANGRIDQYEDFDERGNARIVRQAVKTDGERVIYYQYHPETDALLSRREASVLGAGEKITVWDHDHDGNDVPNEAPTRLARRVMERGYTRDVAGTILPFQYATSFEYDTRGNIVEVDGPRPGEEDIITFTYDPVSGDLQAINFPLVGLARLEAYDEAGQAGRLIDPNGNGVLYVYDGRGRVASVIHENDGATTSYEYHLSGEIAGVTDPDDVTLAFSYDGLYGRLERVEDLLGNNIQYAYDAQGNRAHVSYHDVDGERTYLRRYDFHHPQSPGRLWKEIEPDDSFTEYTYDPMGNLVSVKDPLGRTTLYEYDLFRRLTVVREPEEVTTRYGYDGHGNLVTVTDPEGHATLYVYDDLGRLLETESPDTGKSTYAYDESGNLTERLDANGTIVLYSYDFLDRLTGVHFPDASEDITYQYDEGANGRGRRTGMVDASGNAIYEYDARGNLVKENKTIGEVSLTVKYVFSPAGRVVGLGYPLGLDVLYDLDQAGEVSAVRAWFRGKEYVLGEGFRRLPFGPMEGMRLGNQTDADWGFDESYRVRRIREGSVLDLSYAYDGVGNIVGIENLSDSSRNLAFSYDAVNRVVGATGIYGSIGYTYDRVGNRLSRTHGGNTEIYSYVPGTNKILRVESSSGEKWFGYDSGGNTVTMGDMSLGYSQDSRLKEVLMGGEALGRYQYNGKGERVSKSALGSKVLFDYDQSGRLLGVRCDSDTHVRNHIYLDGRLLAAVDVPNVDVEWKDVDGDGDSDGMDLAGLTFDCGNGHSRDVTGFAAAFGRTDLPALRIAWFHTDHLGTPLKLTNKNGQAVWQADYMPFGEAGILSSTVKNNLRFPGQYYDSETGLHYNYFRYYDPKIGRYLRPDPAYHEFVGGTYGYVGANPVYWVDILGLWRSKAHKDLTTGPMLLAGFALEDARRAAEANVRVDNEHFFDNEYHGTPGYVDRTYRLISDDLEKAIQHELAGEHKLAMETLGKGMHSVQDLAAHRDLGGTALEMWLAHNPWGMDPDDPFLNRQRYAQAYKMTKWYMGEFKRQVCERRTEREGLNYGKP